jgi:hypothetical protein
LGVFSEGPREDVMCGCGCRTEHLGRWNGGLGRRTRARGGGGLGVEAQRVPCWETEVREPRDSSRQAVSRDHCTVGAMDAKKVVTE